MIQLTFTEDLMSTLSVNTYLQLENKCQDPILISVKQTTSINYYNSTSYLISLLYK